MKNEKIKVKGYAKYDRDISPDTFTSLGQCSLKSIRTNEFRNSGTCAVNGCCTTSVMTNFGSAALNRLVADQVRSSGSLRVEKDVSAGTFQAKGHVTIKEELAAKLIRLTMTSNSHIGKICEAKEITVRSHAISTVNFLGIGRKTLKSTRIEGEVVCLEYTIADVVIGDTVLIGKGCKIKEVHYTKTLDVHTKSIVNMIYKKEKMNNEERL